MFFAYKPCTKARVTFRWSSTAREVIGKRELQPLNASE